MCNISHSITDDDTHSTVITTHSTEFPPSCVPDNEICKAAYHLASTELQPAILNHSIRVYIYAHSLAHIENSIYIRPEKISLLFVACILHDIGVSASYNGPQRFEVEGADAAVAHLTKYQVSELDAHEVWQAIALHTSPHIAERIGELPRILRLSVLKDFSSSREDSQIQSRAEVEASFPRMNAEKVLGDAVTEQAIQQPAKAPPASWPGILLRAQLAEPEWNGVNKAF